MSNTAPKHPHSWLLLVGAFFTAVWVIYLLTGYAVVRFRRWRMGLVSAEWWR
jgi:hypothetical protein